MIPKKLHDQLGLAPGDYLEVELEGDHLVFTPKALIEKRLAELKSLRTRLSARMSDIDDYLNWFEAAKLETSSGLFEKRRRMGMRRISRR